jgi:hypothetical protein
MDQAAMIAQRENLVQGLRNLGLELEIRSLTRLYQEAQRRGWEGISLGLAKQALENDTARQVLTFPKKTQGRSHAEGPDERFQIDLLDFAQNARTTASNCFALLAIDVFTREARGIVLPDKRPATVNQAARQAIGRLRDRDGSYVVTTDKGKEFSRLAEALPGEGVHRHKLGAQDISVLDRTAQSLKRDMAAATARSRTEWGQEYNRVINAYNRRGHGALFGQAPENADDGDAVEFYVLQDNARKLAWNDRLYRRRLAEARSTMTVRPAQSRGGRSWNYAFGDPVQAAPEGVKSDWLTLANGKRTLLKEALVVPRNATPAVGTLTDPTLSRRNRLRSLADELEAYLIDQGGQERITDLEQGLRRNQILPRLKLRLATANLGLQGFVGCLRIHFMSVGALCLLSMSQQRHQKNQPKHQQNQPQQMLAHLF